MRSLKYIPACFVNQLLFHISRLAGCRPIPSLDHGGSRCGLRCWSVVGQTIRSGADRGRGTLPQVRFQQRAGLAACGAKQAASFPRATRPSSRAHESPARRLFEVKLNSYGPWNGLQVLRLCVAVVPYPWRGGVTTGSLHLPVPSGGYEKSSRVKQICFGIVIFIFTTTELDHKDVFCDFSYPMGMRSESVRVTSRITRLQSRSRVVSCRVSSANTGPY